MARTAAKGAGRKQAARPRPLELESVVCFEYLEVGPVKIEPRKLSCPYRIRRGTKVWTFDLEYSYEEDVFSPDDAGGENLAAMITAPRRSTARGP